MTPKAGSLEDVEAWAHREFPIYFTKVADVTNVAELAVDTLEFDGEYEDGKVILQSMLIFALQVGRTCTGRTVYSRLSGDNDVMLFSEHQIISSKNTDETVRYMRPVTGLEDMTLSEPFRFSVDSKHAAGVDRLEAFIRYIYLKNGEESAVQPNLGFFKAHFRAACRDVALGCGVTADDDEMDDGDTLPDDVPPDLIADTDVDSLHDHPVAAAIFNQYVHAMDESYHDFKTKMLAKLAAMQVTDRNHMAQIQAQVQDREHRLAVSEEGHRKLRYELETEKVKVKRAEDEAASWKAQYEGLKAILQGALVQRF